MSRSFQAVSFDVGGTLIEPWPSVGHVYAQVLEDSGIPGRDPDRINAQFVSAWKTRQRFGYSRQDWAELVESSLAGCVAPEMARQLFPTIYDRFTEARCWRIFDDVRPALDELKVRGFRLAVTSNWDERLEQTLRSNGLWEYFEVVTASGPLGCHKPEAEIFHSTCRAMRLAPNQVLHVGDSRAEDFEGARQAGLSALHLRRHCKAGDNDEEITDLRQLGSQGQSR